MKTRLARFQAAEYLKVALADENPNVSVVAIGDLAKARVSDLVRGKWEKFSPEMLITLEARIGRIVRVELAA